MRGGGEGWGGRGGCEERGAHCVACVWRVYVLEDIVLCGVTLWTHQCVLDVDTSVCTGCGHISVYWMWTHQRVLDVDTPACTGCGHITVYWMWTRKCVISVLY